MEGLMSVQHIPTSATAPSDVISDDTAVAFLSATNPCFGALPTEFREAAREYLQRLRDLGDLTDEHLTEFARTAELNRLLQD